MSKSCWRVRDIWVGVRERGIFIMGLERGEGAGTGVGIGAGSFIVRVDVGGFFVDFLSRAERDGSGNPLEGSG